MRFSSLCIGYALLCLLMVRPQQIENRNMIAGSPDAASYMAHATALAFGEFPSYDKEFTTTFPGNYALGPGLAAAPFVFLYGLVDRALNNPIVFGRTEDDVLSSFAPFGFAFAAQLAVFAGLWFSWRACRETGGTNAAWAVFLATVSTGLPIYAFRNPVNSHVFEYATGAFTLFVVTAARSGSLVYSGRLRAYALAGLVALFLCRYNDIVIGSASALAALISARRRPSENNASHRILDVIEIGAVALAAVYLSKLLVDMTLDRYASRDFWMPSQLKEQLLSWRGIHYYVARVFHVFFAPDWGLVFTAPLLLLGLWQARRLTPPLVSILLLAPLLINLAMVICWGSQGAEYGYRYFIFSALPVATLGLSEWMSEPSVKRNRLSIAALLAVFPTICVVAFSTQSLLSTHLVLIGRGQAWTNDTLMLEMARQTLFHPLSLVTEILRNSALQFFLYPVTAASFAKWLSLFIVPLAGWNLGRRHEPRRPELKAKGADVVSRAAIFFNGLVRGKSRQ